MAACACGRLRACVAALRGARRVNCEKGAAEEVCDLWPGGSGDASWGESAGQIVCSIAIDILLKL